MMGRVGILWPIESVHASLFTLTDVLTLHTDSLHAMVSNLTWSWQRLSRRWASARWDGPGVFRSFRYRTPAYWRDYTVTSVPGLCKKVHATYN